MIIEVTEDDIQNGVRTDTTKCPVARALQRAFPKAKIRVDYFFIDVDDQRYRTSRALQSFIRDFDAGESVGEIRLILDDLAMMIW